jgi:transcriptional regulator with XRE-family HTH domain
MLVLKKFLIMNFNELLGQRIKEARETQKLLQKDVYEQLDMKKSTYSDIETGHVGVSVETLNKIAEVLKVPIVKLLGIKDSNIQYISNNQNILVSQNHSGNLTIQLNKDFLDQLK